MSSAFCGRYVDPYFSLTYQEAIRKIFGDSQQSEHYFTKKQAEFYRTHMPVFKLIKTILTQKGSKLGILAFDPTLAENTALPHNTPSAYPCNLVLTFEVGLAEYKISLTIDKSMAPDAFKRLYQKLQKALERDSDELLQNSQNDQDFWQKLKPEILIQDRYAVYAMLNFDLLPENKTYFQSIIKNVAHNAKMALDQKFNDPEFRQSLGAQPLPIQPVIDAALAKGYSYDMIFRPFGPGIADDLPGLLSLRLEKGQALIVVLMAFGSCDWNQVSSSVQEVFIK